MKKYILTIDQGTTGSTAALVDAKNFNYIGDAGQDFKQIFPRPGHVEHNLNEIWESVTFTIKKVLRKYKVKPSQIISIGITNQRETSCAFNKKGVPLSNALVWQDRRTIDVCQKLKESGHEKRVKEKTGLPIDPYFSATKMNWMIKNNTRVAKALNNHDLCFGTIDTFLLYKLTSGDSYLTEASNASRTLLMNLNTFNWDPELLDLFGINPDNLPKINPSFGFFGKTKNLKFLPDDIPITGILGDQQSALFGQAGTKVGDIKCTYGTGAFILLNTGNEIRVSKNGLLTTAFYSHNNVKYYALEGSCYIAGAAVQWFRDNLKLVKTSAEIELLSKKIKDLSKLEHLYFLPFFSGLASPYWKPEAKAAILGMTRDTAAAEIARALLEGVALSINDLIIAFSNDSGIQLNSLNVDGGMSMNNLFLQIQSNFSNINIVRPKNIETTAYGAALASAVGLGILNIDDVKKYWKSNKIFKTETKFRTYYDKKKNNWEKIISKLFL